MSEENREPKTSRKLFFGLFVFPVLIAVGMAALLCFVVLLTSEEESAESLLAAIKSGSPGKRLEKAYELSNELNRGGKSIRTEGIMREIVHILQDSGRYDPKTRRYMAVALSHFEHPEAVHALKESLNDADLDVQLYALWSLGALKTRESVPAITPFLKSEDEALRKMAAYVLGILGDPTVIPELKGLLNDPVADVQWNAALGLARLGDRSGLEVLLSMLNREALSRRRLSQDQIEGIMVSAAKGLAFIEEPRAVEGLERAARGDKSLKVRQAALEAIEYQKGKKESE
ncbi:MAG: HEAT repeat domain-containing protein [Candidatus Omnitrophica bacterium]|nr:HEAT repeat domain-containing protein [Candidatus Omnitrophota bacterium]